MSTYNEFVTATLGYAERHPEQRLGKACVNSLSYMRGNRFTRTLSTDPSNADVPALRKWFTEVESRW